MDLKTLTASRYVRVGLEADHKEAAIAQLLECLIAEGAVPREARADVLTSILKRERRLSTGLEEGIAIPHGTTVVLEQEVAALGVFPSGVPFDAVDEAEVRIVLLLVTPLAKRFRHVSNLAAIARQLRRAELRAAILAARSQEELVAVLETETPA